MVICDNVHHHIQPHIEQQQQQNLHLRHDSVPCNSTLYGRFLPLFVSFLSESSAFVGGLHITSVTVDASGRR
ncbi:hypothetical protein BLA29_002819 [Euroglyphus maynei]|uniref:Uncharacterized protein n=1 Tax=Euroglyphus maynei TaxID=6958 RepID=A0A1Y3BDG2_EURMA|nr:hypothetical protein BLA29_002819 [Euroglyphus maynei]